MAEKTANTKPNKAELSVPLCIDVQVERAPMDVPKAMSILGFSAARIFESTTLPEIEKKFTSRIHALETYRKPIDGGNDKRGTSWMSPLKVSSCTLDGASCIQSDVPSPMMALPAFSLMYLAFPSLERTRQRR